jgi:hypothetical protein
MPYPVRHLAALGLTLLSTACSSWHPQSQPAPEVLATNEGRAVRVLLQDGSSLQLTHARMLGDTLAGYSVSGGDTTQWRLAPDDIRGLEVRKSDSGTTAAAVIGVGALLVGVGLIAVNSGTYCC